MRIPLTICSQLNLLESTGILDDLLGLINDFRNLGSWSPFMSVPLVLSSLIGIDCASETLSLLKASLDMSYSFSINEYFVSID